MKKYKESQSQFSPTRDSRPSPLLVDILGKERVDVAPTKGMASVAVKAENEQARAAAAA